MAGVIEGFRWALRRRTRAGTDAVRVGRGGRVVLLAAGLLFFRRLEGTFADVL